MAEAESGKISTRNSLISSDEMKDVPFISQRDYAPTPYTATNWEIVGEPIRERNFVPLELSILQSENSEPDPMFEVFSQGFSAADEKLVHGGGIRNAAGESEDQDAPLSEAQLQAIESEWLVKVEAARQEGHAAGIRDTEVKIMERYELLSERLKGITDSIYEQWSGLAAVLERHAVELALQVSKKILATTVEVKPDYILTVVRQGLQEMGAAKAVRIRVSIDDFEFMNVIGLPLELSEKELGVTYVADESIKSGCVIETNFGEVDLVLDRMWEQVRDLIYQTKAE